MRFSISKLVVLHAAVESYILEVWHAFNRFVVVKGFNHHHSVDFFHDTFYNTKCIIPMYSAGFQSLEVPLELGSKFRKKLPADD